MTRSRYFCINREVWSAVCHFMHSHEADIRDNIEDYGQLKHALGWASGEHIE